MKTINAGIIGGAGYTGGETIRLLINHPHVNLVSVHSRSHAGQPLHSVHADLQGDTDLVFSHTIPQDVDVLFLCLGHGESKKFLQENPFPPNTRIIDLSQDFRLGETLNGKPFTYGLPELNREAIRQSTHIANPGCFATAIELALLPLAKEGLLTPVHATGITGSTGAGQKLQDTTHFTWRANNISAYKTLTHQHLKEIGLSLRKFQPSFGDHLHFIPWRGDFARGIFVSACLDSTLSLEKAKALYRDFYAAHPFTIVSDGAIDLKQAVNTNKCLIGLEKEGDKLVVHSAIDNLLKGASGQAVHNMNLMMGFEEKAGLKLKGIVF